MGTYIAEGEVNTTIEALKTAVMKVGAQAFSEQKIGSMNSTQKQSTHRYSRDDEVSSCIDDVVERYYVYVL